jgi:Spy/CpxP family protein refolding chaperone
MKKSIKTLAVVFSVALNIAFLASYGIRKLHDRPRFAYQELDLSEEQRRTIEHSRDKFLGSIDEIGDKILSQQVELIDLVAADEIDCQALATKFKEIHALQQAMQEQVMEHLMEHKQIMTPAQRARFFAILKSRIQEQGAPGPPWLPSRALRER